MKRPDLNLNVITICIHNVHGHSYTIHNFFDSSQLVRIQGNSIVVHNFYHKMAGYANLNKGPNIQYHVADQTTI